MTFEVLVLPDIRHGAQHVDERTPARLAKDGLKNLSMLLLDTPIVPGSPERLCVRRQRDHALVDLVREPLRVLLVRSHGRFSRNQRSHNSLYFPVFYRTFVI